MTLQYREAVGTETRSYDDGLRQVEAKVCSYGVGPDTFNTTWADGWAREALEKSLPAVCWGHDQRDIVGSVISYRDAPGDGLYMTMQFADPDDVPSARRAFSLVRDGHVKGWSYGFSGAKGKPDPQYRGATQFVSGTIHEISPVLRASVPGTRTISVRAAGEDTAVDVAETALTPHLAQAFAEALSEGARSLTISIGDDGTVSTTGNPASVGTLDLGDDGSDGTDSPEALAGAVDAALDEACSLLDGIDTTQLPDAVQQALALVVAASTTVDELLDAMGVPDPDDTDDDTERAAAVTTPAAPKAGDTVTITGGKGTGKTGKITRIMPNGVLLVDVGGSAPVMVSPKNAKPANARSADEPDEVTTHPEDPEIRAALDDLERLHHTR